MSDCDVSVEIEESEVYEITLPTDNPIYVDTGLGSGGVLGSLTWGQITDKPIIVLNEAPTGLINGVNKIFTTNNPVMDLTIWVFLNGLKLTPPDYTLSDASTITLADAPLTDDLLIVDYIKES